MARQEPPQGAPPHAAPAATPARKGTHTVTFPGQPSVTVTAGNEEEAVTKAKEALGVLSSEKPPDVVKL